jgi:hypothetical protein
MYRPRRSDAGACAPMRWLTGRQRSDATGQAHLQPSFAGLPVTIQVDPTNGYLHVVSTDGQFAVYGSAQPMLTQRRHSRRRTPRVPQPGYGAAAQVPPERTGRHRAENPAHGRHAARSAGEGNGSWSTSAQQRKRTVLGMSFAELGFEMSKFSGIGWIGLGASILGSSLTGSAVWGFVAAAMIAPFQGVISAYVNTRRERKATAVDKAQNRELNQIEAELSSVWAELREVQAELSRRGILAQTPHSPQGGGMYGQPQPSYGSDPHSGSVLTAPTPRSYQGRAPNPPPPFGPGTQGAPQPHLGGMPPRRGVDPRQHRGPDPRQHGGPEPRQPGS